MWLPFWFSSIGWIIMDKTEVSLAISDCVNSQPDKDVCQMHKDVGRCRDGYDYASCRKTCGCGTCFPNPCMNNGTCKAHIGGYIECSCRKGYAGLRCEYQDAYIELKGSACLRRERVNSDKLDRYLIIEHAKDECSKNQRCIGLESVKGLEMFGYFTPCLDAIYTSTAWDKYENKTQLVYMKLKSRAFHKSLSKLRMALVVAKRSQML